MLSGIRWESLRTKIIAWSFVPTMIILVVVAVVIFYAYQDVTEDLVIERNREQTFLAAGQFAAELREYADLLDAEARTSDVHGNDPVAQRDALKGASNRLVVFDAGVLILDTFGTVVAAEPERPQVLEQNWSDRTYYRQVLHSQIWGSPGPLFSDIVADGPDGEEVIVVAVPITDPQGEFVGTIAGMFRLGATTASAFYGDIVKLRLGESGSAYLVDGNGRVIYHSDPDRIGDYFSAQEVVQQVLSGEVGADRTRDLDGREIVASFAPVPGTSWGLVTQESWAALARSSRGYRQFLLLLLALGVIVPALVVAVGVRRITRPIAELTDAVQQVAKGNFGQTIATRTGDEIEELAMQFNLMSAQLQDSYAHLEQRVADRTKELATLNAVAQTVSQSLELEAMLTTTLDKVLEVLEFESGAIYLKNLKTGELQMACHRGLSDAFRRVVAKGIISARTAESGNPIIIDNLPKEPDAPKEVVEEGYRSVASIPLLSKGQLHGVLTTASRHLRRFRQEDVDLLLSIGHQIGVAIENARLFNAEQRQAEQFRVISEVGRRITSILAVDELLVQIARLIQEAFNYYHVGIGLIEGDEVVYRVGAGILWDDPQFQFKPARLRVGEEGITGWVAATGESRLVPDVSQEPRYVWMHGSKTRSELTMPIMVKGQVIGVLDVQSDRLNAFDRSDLVVLQSLAHQAAIAIENARLFAQAEQRMRELEALYRAEEELNRAEEELYRHLRLDQVLQALVNVAMDLLQADKSSLLVWDAQRERLVVGAARGFSPKTLAQMSFAPGEGIAGRVAASGEPMVVEDTLTDSRVTKRFTEPEGIYSFMHVPIKIGGQVFGVFNVNYAQSRAFSSDDLRLCLALAQRAALAIENARLYEQAQQVATLEERQRLARELHDSVTQALYGVTLYAEAAARLLSSGEMDMAADHLRDLRDTAQEALREMRLLIFELRPPVLQKEGLAAALQARLEAVEGRAGLETEFEVEGEGHLSPEIEEELYRIAQEALNNALKHAQARRLSVHLVLDEPILALEISDDGVGFDPTIAREQGGLGLCGIEERAAQLGGQLTVQSKPGEGTIIRVEVSR